jgi:5,10-methylene-tetrahydrofolate dehydrogenase/methenyl tetrahydrofolate cyclohydrolase
MIGKSKIQGVPKSALLASANLTVQWKIAQVTLWDRL